VEFVVGEIDCEDRDLDRALMGHAALDDQDAAIVFDGHLSLYEIEVVKVTNCARSQIVSSLASFHFIPDLLASAGL